MKKNIKKFMQYLMLFGMIFSSLQTPIQVFADEIVKNNAEPNNGDIKLGVDGEISETGSVSTEAVSTDGKISVKKTVSKSDAENGKYHVKFEIKGKEDTEETPVYVVIVFDRSGSMCDINLYGSCNNITKWNNAVAGAQTFTDTLLSSLANSKVALVTFASTATKKRRFEHQALATNLFGNATGGTNLHDGLIKANEYLNNNIPDADKDRALKYIVVMSDGKPTYYIDNDGEVSGSGRETSKNILDYTLRTASTIKNNGVSIFSIGYSLPEGNAYAYDYTYNGVTYHGLTAKQILQLVADDNNHYVDANNEDDVVDAFKDLATEIISPGKDAILTDNIGEKFKIVGNENYGGSYIGETITKITNNTVVYEFDIQIDMDNPTGWYQTNDGYNLVYTDNSGVEQTINSSEDPYVYIKQRTYEYKVNYYKDSKTDSNKIATDTREAVKDTVINASNVDKDKYLSNAGLGYEFNSVSPDSITITNDGKVKEINVLYTLKKYNYKVNYYYDNVLDNSISITNIVHGTPVNPSDYYLASEDIKDGYKLDTVNTDSEEIVIDDNNKEINIYYIKDSFGYNVNYYFNTAINTDLSFSNNAIYGTVIKAEDNHLSDTTLTNNGFGDYFLDPDMYTSNYGSITISSNANNNKLNIYYINTVAGNEVIDKTTTNTNITSSNDVVSYTVSYSAKILNVRENEDVAVTIVDTLPYEIDATKSNLNGGVYNATDKTITWVITKKVDSFTREYNVSESVSYKDFADISSSNNNNITNNVLGNVSVSGKTTNGVNDSVSIPVKIDGTLTVKHVDESGNDLWTEVTTTEKVGTSYNETSKEIYGYTFKSNTNNTSGKYKEGNILVVFTYSKNSGEITGEEVAKVGPENISSVDGTFNYSLTYNVELTDYVGKAELTVVDTLPYEIDEAKSTYDDRCVYDKDTLTITCTEEYNIDENNTVIDEEFGLSLVFKNIDSDKVINNVSSELKYGNETEEDEDETETEVFKGIVIATYKDTLGNTLATDERTEDLAGKDYTTSAKPIYGYTLTKEPENKTGVYTEDKIIVKYVYSKNSGTVTENVTTKTQINTILGANSTFKYVLEYNGEITDYTGDATITLTDILPYDVKEITYDEDACSFDNNTRTLVCSKPVAIAENNNEINARFEVVVKYNNLTSTADLSINNEVSAILTYGKSEVPSNGETTDVVKSSEVEAIYVDVDDKELATSEVSTGLIDTDYTTSAKPIYGYTLTKEPENKTGVYTEDKIIVKYVYSKNIGNAEESLQKIGLESVDSVDSAFEYRITYNTSITDYVGDVNILIIDELPYEIDVLKSSIPEVCEYENGLLVCEYNKTIITEEDSNISIDIDLVLYFVNVSDEMVVNKVKSILTYGEEELINEDSTGTKVLSGMVQVNYITDKGEVLDESVIMNGLVGTEYETSKRAFDKYYLKEVIGKENGVYTSEMTEVTYVYSLIPLPPQTGYVGNSTNYIGLIICGIFLLFWKKKIEVK